MALNRQQNTSNTSNSSTPTSLQANILLYLIATIILGTIVGAVLKGMDKLPDNILAIAVSVGGVIGFISLMLGLVIVKPAPAQILAKANIILMLLASLLTVSLLTWGVLAIPPPDPYIQKGTLALDDPLDNNNIGYHWDTGPSTDNTTSCGFPGQGYHVIVQPKHSRTCGAGKTNFQDFVYQITMTTLRGDTTTREMSPTGGIVFRANAHSYYYFYIDTFGYATIGIYRDGGIHDFLHQEQISSFNQGLGVSNFLAVVVRGSRIDFYVNIATIGFIIDPDTSLSSGEIGVLAETYSTASSSAEVEFSNAKVWTL